ncbi:MAG: hypothetical protein QNJ12_21110 [Ilumatobacter sp.]|uniref:hypothetical protein n=1 Tax=Ilumatobacter sp. TaxID=1967498 RepID=UPI00260FDD11|nr:hypothetical protein [Ilumatobacter sp.]MDJ0771302.1 hypothetical protein [Ilumatobacter sp.]
MHRTIPVLLLGTTLLLSSCGDNDADADGSSVRDGVLEVVMADFHYGDLPGEVPAGTRLTIGNESERELHELVAYRLDDADDRSVADIIATDVGALLGGGPPVAVLLASPGGEQIDAVGDGVLSQPGRYVLLCAVPTGADPDEYLHAVATSEGPPDVAGGAPHFAHGMYAELVVT